MTTPISDPVDMLGKLLDESGLTVTISPWCRSGLVGGRKSCVCTRCRGERDEEPLAPELERAAAEGADLGARRKRMLGESGLFICPACKHLGDIATAHAHSKRTHICRRCAQRLFADVPFLITKHPGTHLRDAVNRFHANEKRIRREEREAKRARQEAKRERRAAQVAARAADGGTQE